MQAVREQMMFSSFHMRIQRQSRLWVELVGQVGTGVGEDKTAKRNRNDVYSVSAC